MPSGPKRTTLDLEATCESCGCTDSRACPEGCAWAWVDRQRGVGLCTICQPPAKLRGLFAA